LLGSVWRSVGQERDSEPFQQHQSFPLPKRICSTCSSVQFFCLLFDKLTPLKSFSTITFFTKEPTVYKVLTEEGKDARKAEWTNKEGSDLYLFPVSMFYVDLKGKFFSIH